MNTLHPDSEQVLKDIKEKAARKRKIVFVSGNFNIIHPGHLRLLRFAAKCGSFLVVGVYDDSSQGALLPESLRLEGVRSTSWVDYSFILKDPPEKFIEHLQPAVVVKGKEHEDQFNAELEVVDSYGGKLLFSSGDITFSSIDLLRDEFKRMDLSSIVKPLDFLKRHHFTMADLKSVVEKMSGLNVLVIGETIVDEYITCDPMGMSQEDPTIVVTPILTERFLGAAGIVAAHAKGLGARVDFFSVIGKDETAEYVSEKLDEYGVEAHLYEDESRPTIRKQRFRTKGKTLLRVNHLQQHAINREIQKEILKDLTDILDTIQLVIFSDFNYGCLPQLLVNKIVTLCNNKNIMVVADSQSSSQIGDVSRFKGMILLTPTEREARLAVRDFDSGLVILAEALRKKARAQNILLTLDSEGLLIHAAVSSSQLWLTDRLPAMNTAPKDVAGAGDSLLTCASMAMAVGEDIWKSSYLGSLAAACQGSRVGNIPLTVEELEMEIMR
ncbi:MAG: PfkB family carbohydrate kinase [bacterium]